MGANYPQTVKYLFGAADVPVIAKEYGNEFSIDWITGQKTGFFIDQRENRLLLGKYAKGKRVLNTFCYSGGFSLLAMNPRVYSKASRSTPVRKPIASSMKTKSSVTTFPLAPGA